MEQSSFRQELISRRFEAKMRREPFMQTMKEKLRERAKKIDSHKTRPYTEEELAELREVFRKIEERKTLGLHRMVKKTYFSEVDGKGNLCGEIIITPCTVTLEE